MAWSATSAAIVAEPKGEAVGLQWAADWRTVMVRYVVLVKYVGLPMVSQIDTDEVHYLWDAAMAADAWVSDPFADSAAHEAWAKFEKR